MGLRTALKTWLRPVVAPMRAVMAREIGTIIDARMSNGGSRVPEPVLGRQARLLDLVDEKSHPNADQIWVLVRDLHQCQAHHQVLRLRASADPGSGVALAN